MSWILPSVRETVEPLRRAAGLVKDRHRPGYWRDYHSRNADHRRPYLAKKARKYRRMRRANANGTSVSK